MPLLLIIHGHPSGDSMCEAHTDLAQKVGREKGYDVEILRSFDYPLVGHIMHNGYHEAYTRPADLISQADKIVITYPMWNFSLPGGLLNFLDGALQARKHFRYKLIKVLRMGVPIGQLRTKKLITIYTADGPKWYYRLPLLGMDISRKQIKEIFKMCGISSWKMKCFLLGQCTHCVPERRTKWLKTLEQKLRKHI
ncbi:MAG TPA: NAD(P)H-dependent oxidoreductase [Candidatus Gracilibacteria bacterium]